MTTLGSKTVVIIGGSSGIGYGVAEASLVSGAAVVVIASSNAANVAEAVKQLESAKLGSGRIKGDVVDVRDAKAVETFFGRIGEIDHLVWTSGDLPNIGFPTNDLESTKRMFDVRFWGAVIAAQFAKFRPGGSMTLTTGVTVVKPPKGMAIGTGLGGAVDALTRGLAVDLAPIRVNSICPGYVDTPLLRKLMEGQQDQAKFFQEQREKMRTEGLEKLLIKRISTPAEIAEAYLFVMKCPYITGERIQVDGGYVLGA